MYYRSVAMVVSLRLTKAEERALTQSARRAGVSKSEYLRQCLAVRLRSEVEQPSLYESGKDLFGGDPSGRQDLVTNSEQIVRQKIHDKARRA
jgi:hypothetical protein